MTPTTRARHADHGAQFRRRGGREVPAQYGRPATAHRAVRNGVGVIEMAYDVLELGGPDRQEFVDAAVTNPVTPTDGVGTYALVLDPDGHTVADLYAYSTPDRLLVFLPPGTGDTVATTWRDHRVRRDVSIDSVTTDLGVFGVYGPAATEKVASVLNGAAAPADPLSFVRGQIDGDGVIVVRTDDRPGQEGYEVITRAATADAVLDSLLTKGLNAAPFGYQTWETLTLEAGTPLYHTELADRIPVGLVAGAYDRTSGCYPGQEVIARIEDRGRPPGRLQGLSLTAVPATPAPVSVDGDEVGVLTRAADPPTSESAIALAILDPDLDSGAVTVAEDIDATVQSLPFLEGSTRSRRCPR
ncbi:MAG: aminomethyl transferase family protein [Halobacteriaceae archaeon]